MWCGVLRIKKIFFFFDSWSGFSGQRCFYGRQHACRDSSIASPCGRKGHSRWTTTYRSALSRNIPLKVLFLGLLRAYFPWIFYSSCRMIAFSVSMGHSNRAKMKNRTEENHCHSPFSFTFHMKQSLRIFKTSQSSKPAILLKSRPFLSFFLCWRQLLQSSTGNGCNGEVGNGCW